jgi:GNAT superfamily N-acetyltransferase
MLIRPLRPEDAAALRRLRLEALQSCPTAFGASHAEAELHSEADFAASIADASPGAIFGAFDDRPMVGMAGLMAHASEKKRHKAMLWGVYVCPTHLRRGIARALVEAAIARARPKVAVLQTGVVAGNEVARTLYLSLGFRPFGTEAKALCVDGVYYDEEHLALDFTEVAARP